MYFRVMLIGFFEGIESERGIAWGVADSLGLRVFLQIGLDERTPDHVTISRTRRLLDEATHPRPNFELIKKRSAEWLGGSPEEHTDLILVLWALAHGTASLLISRAVPSLHETDLRSVADRAAALLVQNASILSARK